MPVNSEETTDAATPSPGPPTMRERCPFACLAGGVAVRRD